MKILTIIWNFLNGNKTIICFGITTMLQEAVEIGLIDDTKLIQWIVRVLLILGGGALTHHISKGYFNQGKGS
jgi:hypothetical protein